MKKRFTLDVMYGDADGFDTFSYISEDDDEIGFLTYFLENYDESLFDFYDRPDLFRYNKKFKNNEDELISIINNMATMANVICEKKNFTKIELIEEDAYRDDIHDVLVKVMCFVENYFDWYMHHAGMDYYGSPEVYSIEDITGCTEITKEEAVALIKEKLGIDVVFVD